MPAFGVPSMNVEICTYKVTSFFIGRYQENYFDKAVVIRANWVFIAKTPFDKLYNTSVIPKIVPIDKRTMLVDTKM